MSLPALLAHPTTDAGSLRGRVVVVTGGARGLGAAIWVTRAGGADVAFVSALDSCDILYSLRMGGAPTP